MLLGNLFGMGASFVSKYKGSLMTGMAILTMLSGAYSAGYISGGQAELKVHQVQVQGQQGKAFNALLKQDNAAQVQRVEVKVRDIARERDLQTKIDAIQEANSSLAKELYETNALNPDCRLPIGTVILLNSAKLGWGGGDPKRVSDPSVVASYQESTPSTVTCGTLAEDDLAVTEQYQTLRAKNDTLIDWAQKELIDPMQAHTMFNNK